MAKIARTLPGNCRESGNSRAMLNVNVPSVPESEIRGIKLTKLESGVTKMCSVNAKIPGKLLAAKDIVDDDQDEDTDVMAIRDNFVTMTPVFRSD